ncbi:hypothetical protein AURANDRAFT_68461, partial [Aureococcus anophagefferens]
MRPTRGGLVATAALLLVRATMSSAGGGGGACNDTAGDDVVRRQPRQVAHVDHLALPHSGSTTVATALRRALEARAIRGAASCAKCSAAACGADALLPVRATLVYRAGHAHFPLAERRAHIASDWADGAVSRAREASGGARQAEHETRMGLRGPSPRVARPGAVVTVHVLREPVTWLWRTLMRFSYMPVEGAARRGSRTASGATHRGRARGEPASAWLERNPFAWNMQAQFLAGRPRFDCNRTLAAARDDADPEALLPRAEAELADEAALAFGLFERLEDSAQLIAHALCLPKATLVAGETRRGALRASNRRSPRSRSAPPSKTEAAPPKLQRRDSLPPPSTPRKEPPKARTPSTSAKWLGAGSCVILDEYAATATPSRPATSPAPDLGGVVATALDLAHVPLAEPTTPKTPEGGLPRAERMVSADFEDAGAAAPPLALGGDDAAPAPPDLEVALAAVAHVDHLALPHSGSTTVATALRRALEARALLGAASCAKCSAAACGADAPLPVRATLVYRAGHAHFPLAERRAHIASDWADGAVSRAREASGGARQAEHETRVGLRGPSPRVARPGAVVTVHVLREPVTWLWRTLMRFSYMPVEGAARRGSRTASGATHRGRARGEPASAWLERNPFAWNMQAQFLAGRPRFDCNRTLAAARDDADPEALLPRAEAELADEAALAFGLFERLEDSAQLIAHALCLPKATLVAG